MVSAAVLYTAADFHIGSVPALKQLRMYDVVFTQ
jgi:hypothetical protein